ncbi:DUF6779 domain-containing protein [Corynebacterium neomassiliense]|uniref:DUF6779 domain-containing protein n=1 Tax=Corynebacterium neomassiliense TaxID=2079482 RepID=UPI0010315E71|nr:DUF6779 domain-containing protein [Corynebacterium neomassiliense]
MSSAYPSPDLHRLPDPNSAQTTRAPGTGWKLLMFLLLALALAATVIMFFVDNDFWINMAVIAALWAAFIGAVLVFRYSGALGEETTRSEERDARRLAELDAERAEHRRREAELEKTLAQSAADGSPARDETLESIRAELAALRAQLSELSGLDLSEDQVAVRARAERIIELERRSGETPAPGTPEGAASSAAPVPSAAPEVSGEDRGPGAAPHQGARRGGFATGTFSAVNWAGADSEETSMIPLVVDTRDIDRDRPAPSAPAESPAPAGPTAETSGIPAAGGFPAGQAGGAEDSGQAGHHRRTREVEDPHGRRRADERAGAGGSVTVAELMAQLKKNAR